MKMDNEKTKETGLPMVQSDQKNHSLSPEMRNLITSGNRDLDQGNWSDASEKFDKAVSHHDHPEAWFGLAEASWWLGDLQRTITSYERAYKGFRNHKNQHRAAETALRLALENLSYSGNETIATGWLSRARRLIREYHLDSLTGNLLVLESCFSDNPDDAENFARKALEWARDSEDRDLELMALSSIGVALVNKGCIQQGLDTLDEALAGSLGGEPDHPYTVVFTCCDMMVSSSKCAAFEQTLNCMNAAARFERQYGCPFLYLECRAIHANVLLATGKWAEAEKNYKQVIEQGRDSVPAYVIPAIAGLAELRLLQGKTEEAGRIIDGYHDHPTVLPVLAWIMLNQDQPDIAITALKRRLTVIGDSRLESARLLELYGEAELLQGKIESAFERGRMLVQLGSNRGCRLMIARGERLQGQSLSFSNDSASACRHFDKALSEFVPMNMPFEIARTHHLIAGVLRETEPATSVSEAKTALSGFQALGAAQHTDAAAQLLRELGISIPRTATRGQELLTRREKEVLTLIGEGLSNPKIAERLFISRKTVEHHVSSILSKLNLKNRANAAAEAVRRRS